MMRRDETPTSDGRCGTSGSQRRWCCRADARRRVAGGDHDGLASRRNHPAGIRCRGTRVSCSWSSMAVLRLSSKVRRRLESSTSRAWFVDRGRLRAHVPEQARGFAVLAPTFELVDLGTEFGLNVAEDGVDEIHVFDGKVELYDARIEPRSGNTSRAECGRRTDGRSRWDFEADCRPGGRLRHSDAAQSDDRHTATGAAS